jgi:hypothetical protein
VPRRRKRPLDQTPSAVRVRKRREARRLARHRNRPRPRRRARARGGNWAEAGARAAGMRGGCNRAKGDGDIRGSRPVRVS